MTTQTPHLKPGDIMVSVSGYSSTFADFYQIERLTNSTIFLTPIDKHQSPDSTLGTKRFLPCPSTPIGPTFRRKLHAGTAAHINEHATATRWDGHPVTTENIY